jgi:hypothetical protein
MLGDFWCEKAVKACFVMTCLNVDEMLITCWWMLIAGTTMLSDKEITEK